MDRLTREEIEEWRHRLTAFWLAGKTIKESQEAGNALCDLALQSLSQEAVREEAVRDEAVREIINELAAIADACVDLQQNRKRPNSDPVMGWDNAPLTLGTLRKARALKREPNAAAPEGPAHGLPCWPVDGPTPAAPDVASMVKRLRECCTMIGYATSGAERASHKRNADDAEAALLARLGQGWIPVKFENAKEVVEITNGKTLGRSGEIIYNVERWGEAYQFKLPDLPPAPGASDD